MAFILPGAVPGAAAAAEPHAPVRYADGAATGDGLPRDGKRSLVLYDTSGSQPKTKELRTTMVVNLVSHFGGWTAHPVDTYRPREMMEYDAVFYLGDPGGARLPDAFLDDAVRPGRRIVWISGDIEQLQAHGGASPHGGYGFTPRGTEATTALVRMTYRGTELAMDQDGEDAFTRIGVDDVTKATVLATAWRADGSSVPWAVRSGNLTYLGEDPVRSQYSLEGRILTFADLLHDILDPDARPRHRALVRLEDVNPTTDPANLRAVADYLAGQKVPFAIAVYPVYRDPNAPGAGGDGITIRLSERPEVVAALRYAIAHGGTLVLHGYTHQYGTKNNPHNGRSGEDTEFYLCHLDGNQLLQLDGPVPEDSEAWALGRIDQALAELLAAGLPAPQAWEFPHYLASATNYRAVAKRFRNRYERGLYVPGPLTGSPDDETRPLTQVLPYAVRDVYATAVIPENLGYVLGDGSSIADMLDTARDGLVVRDGVASFFYHPFLGVGELPRLVDGIRELGYTFVAGSEVALAP